MTQALEAFAAHEEATAQASLDAFKAMPCTNLAEKEAVGMWVSEIRKKKAEFAKARSKWTSPAHQAWKAACAFFKPTTDLLDQCDKVLTAKLQAYVLEEARRKQAELAEAAKQGPQAVQAAVVRAREEPAAPAALSSVTVHEFVLEDINKVPREYLELSRTLINKAIARGVRDIPGGRVVESVQFRRK